MQVLTFDFHNTLVHCDPWFELEVRTLPRKVARSLALGVEIPDDRFDIAYREIRQQAVASGIEVDALDGVCRVFDQVGVAASLDVVAGAIDDLMRDAQVSVEPVAGAVDAVQAIYRRGVPLGVVSSAVHHDTLVWSLDRIGLGDAFDVIVSSASCGYYKSSPAIYHHALAALGATAPLSVHIGDSLKWDVTVSREAGMHPVWLQTSRQEVFSQGLPVESPVLTLQSLAGAGPILLDLLDTIRSDNQGG